MLELNPYPGVQNYLFQSLAQPSSVSNCFKGRRLCRKKKRLYHLSYPLHCLESNCHKWVAVALVKYKKRLTWHIQPLNLSQPTNRHIKVRPKKKKVHATGNLSGSSQRASGPLSVKYIVKLTRQA